MSVLDTAREHYKNVLGSTPKSLVIEEWGGEFFVRPQISARRKLEIQQKLTDGKNMAEGLALTLIYYLVNKDGEPVFNKGEVMDLCSHVDPDVLIRVAGQIGEMQPKMEDVEGN